MRSLREAPVAVMTSLSTDNSWKSSCHDGLSSALNFGAKPSAIPQGSIVVLTAVAEKLRAKLVEMKKAGGPDDAKAKTAWTTMLKCESHSRWHSLCCWPSHCATSQYKCVLRLAGGCSASFDHAGTSETWLQTWARRSFGEYESLTQLFRARSPARRTA